MRHRRLLLFGLGLAGLAVIGSGLVTWLTVPADRINRKNYDLIRHGMTEQDVEEILGAPPGDYSHGTEFPRFLAGACDACDFEDPPENEEPHRWKVWAGYDGRVEIAFNEEGRVIQKVFLPPWRSADSFVAKVRRLLHV